MRSLGSCGDDKPPHIILEQYPIPPITSRARLTISRVRNEQNTFASDACSSVSLSSSCNCESRNTIVCMAVIEVYVLKKVISLFEFGEDGCHGKSLIPPHPIPSP